MVEFHSNWAFTELTEAFLNFEFLDFAKTFTLLIILLVITLKMIVVNLARILVNLALIVANVLKRSWLVGHAKLRGFSERIFE